MTNAERIREICTSRAALLEADALLHEGDKKAFREGAARACHWVARHYAGLELGALQEELEKLAASCCRQANNVRYAFPLLSVSLEGNACAYKEIAGLCERMAEAADDHDYDAMRETVSLRAEQRDYREDVRRGMRP